MFGWTADAATSHRLLDALKDAGLNFIDTADVYSAWVPGHSGGESEAPDRPVAEGARRTRCDRHRHQCGMDMGAAGKGLSAKHIASAVDASLKRLNTDYIDLYQSHADDPTVPLAETLEAFDSLIKAGKVRAIGASNYSAERLQEALTVSAREGLARYETLQPHYNLYERAKFEGREPGPVRQGRHRRHSLFQPGLGVPDGQVPFPGRTSRARAAARSGACSIRAAWRFWRRSTPWPRTLAPIRPGSPWPG
ncbi:MAG: aldo/keto reductase [Caulobacteraceae bacterium]